MASARTEPKCALCGRAVDPLKSFFRAAGDFLPPKDPLTRFCNASMHWACYARWAERPRFARCYVQAWVQANRKNPFWWSVHEDDQVYVSINPQKPVEEAAVRLLTIGDDIRVPLPRWAEWLADVERVTPGLQALEKKALAEVLPRLRKRFPDDHALVDAIDPDEKRARRRATAGPSKASN